MHANELLKSGEEFKQLQGELLLKQIGCNKEAVFILFDKSLTPSMTKETANTPNKTPNAD